MFKKVRHSSYQEVAEECVSFFIHQQAVKLKYSNGVEEDRWVRQE
jgi:hypothetical protein